MTLDAWVLELRTAFARARCGPMELHRRTAYAHQEFGSRVCTTAWWRPLNTYRLPDRNRGRDWADSVAALGEGFHGRRHGDRDERLGLTRAT